MKESDKELVKATGLVSVELVKFLLQSAREPIETARDFLEVEGLRSALKKGSFAPKAAIGLGIEAGLVCRSVKAGIAAGAIAWLAAGISQRLRWIGDHE